MVYKGSKNGQGLTAYKDGTQTDEDTQWSDDGNTEINSEDSGNSDELMIGRLYNKATNGKYAKCEVDELLIWNIELYSAAIKQIYDSYQVWLLSPVRKEWLSDDSEYGRRLGRCTQTAF